MRHIDLHAAAGTDLLKLPHVLRILLENVLRHSGQGAQSDAILDWLATGQSEASISFWPTRVMMHDTTCGPALVDIAAMRDELAREGFDPTRLNPVLPVDVSTDHSLAVESFGYRGASVDNLRIEYQRNAERYSFMKWASQSMDRLRVHPPGTGIMHTLNLEQLASVVSAQDGWLVPDTLIGTDSHTPMVNGIGVLGWGVGGIEAETVLFGMPVNLRIPDVVGLRLTGALPPGVLSTDLALAVTALLRRHPLQSAFVEFFGPGVSTLTAGDRAVVANMTPEFGGATGFFPVDQAVLEYLRQTGRSDEHIARVENYCRSNGLWFDPQAEPRFTRVIDLDLASLAPSLAGPTRPQDLLRAGDTKRILGLDALGDRAGPVPQGAVALAAITSCTNTSDPRLLIAAGLMARKARALGLRPPSWVKTSLAPGSPSAQGLLERAGLLADLEAIGFAIVGYGCASCIGNSGALQPQMEAAIAAGVTPVAVLSGNRNFPRRVHGLIRHAFLGSPPMVIAFALAGDVMRDIMSEPIAPGVRLADLWPRPSEIEEALQQAIDPDDYSSAYKVAQASADWTALPARAAALYPWDAASSYLRPPPFAGSDRPKQIGHFVARPLAIFGDDMTTDHISPAGAIPLTGAAGRYLTEHGVKPADMNVFSSRRGNWEVMLRGLFTHPEARNLQDPQLPPGWTHAPDKAARPLFEAAQEFGALGQSLILVAGERYGMGSSRDWAAKGLALLGIRAVLASSFERIHRANLIGMGILPLRLPAGLTAQDLAAKLDLRIEIHADTLSLRGAVRITLHLKDDRREEHLALAEIETDWEIATLEAGGVIPQILARTKAP